MALSLAACGTQKRETLELFAMDTYMTFVAIGDGADDVLTDLSRTVNTLESSLSRTVDTSEVSRLNRDGSAVWDEDGAQLLSWALQHSQETDGAFDITIAPLVELWGITSDSPRVPSQAEIDALLPLVGYEHVHQSEFCSISLDEGCSVDLGGIAKGYASDRVAAIFARHGITSGTTADDLSPRSALTGGCANLGGNVYVYGTNAQNKPWSVAIQDPADSEGYVCTLSLSDAFVVTSGGYQRYFTAPDGTVYQHILDPKTGYPVQSDLTSVSVVTRGGFGGQGTRADAYSTALYVMGEQAAVDFWRSQDMSFDMVLITRDGRVVYTPGLADCFNEKDGTAYVYQLLAS